MEGPDNNMPMLATGAVLLVFAGVFARLLRLAGGWTHLNRSRKGLTSSDAWDNLIPGFQIHVYVLPYLATIGASMVLGGAVLLVAK